MENIPQRKPRLKVIRKSRIAKRGEKRTKSPAKVRPSTDSRAFLAELHPDGVFEIRVPSTCRNNPQYKKTASGYFSDHDAVQEYLELEDYHNPPGIYVTLNPVKPDLLARARNVIVFGAQHTTSDEEVASRRWIVIDIDPVRPAAISSTNQERDAAVDAAKDIRAWLKIQGWPMPMLMMSGNGAYLLYRVELPNDEQSTALVRAFLAVLARKFDSSKVKIDKTVFNSSRIIKIAGTVARKGDSLVGEPGIPDRPHRRSYYYPPTTPQAIVSAEQIRWIADDEIRRDMLVSNACDGAAAPRPFGAAGQGIDGTLPKASDSVLASCKLYVSKMDPATEGENGSGQTFKVACALAKFGLDMEQAEQVMSEYSRRCDPPWTPRDLLHKLRDAYRRVMDDGEFGVLSGGRDLSYPAPDRRPLKDASANDVAASFVDKLKDADGHLLFRRWRQAILAWHSGRFVEVKVDELKSELILYLQGLYSGIKSILVNDIMTNVLPLIEVDSRLDLPIYLGDDRHVLNQWRKSEIYIGPAAITHLPSLFTGAAEHSVRNTPEYVSLVANATEIQPDAGPPSAWLGFLDAIFCGDQESIQLLQQWMGYLLTPDTSQQKLMLLIGPARSGKGTIARVIESIAGAGNCCAPTMDDLSSTFGLSVLLGKCIATIGDARLSGRSHGSTLVERLLSISGEDSITVNRKHRDLLTARLTTRFTILTNELPRIDDASAVVATRFLVVSTKKSFLGCEDLGLMDRLTAEKNAILYWALQGWHSLHRSGKFIETVDSRKAQAELRRIASPVAHFVEDMCVLSPDLSISKEELYREYRDWCHHNGFDKRAKTSPIFAKDLPAACSGVKACRRRVGVSGRRTQVWRGIDIRRR